MDSSAVDHQLTTDGSDVSVQLADHGQHVQQSNDSSSADDVNGFLRVYFSPTRFTAETVMAVLSAGINVAVLTTLVITD